MQTQLSEIYVTEIGSTRLRYLGFLSGGVHKNGPAEWRAHLARRQCALVRAGALTR